MRFIIVKSFLTRYLDENHSSMRSYGHTITGPEQRKNGLRNMIIFCFMQRIHHVTPSMWKTLTESHTWHQDLSGLKKPRKVSFQPIPGGTLVPPGGKESTGYATQKPLAILKRIVTASSNIGDTVLDFFAGSGTTGLAAFQLSRGFILIDNNEDAMRAMAKRFPNTTNIHWVGFELDSTPRDNSYPR